MKDNVKVFNRGECSAHPRSVVHAHIERVLGTPPPTGCWSISLVNIEIMAAENIKAMAVLVQATSAYTDNTAKNK